MSKRVVLALLVTGRVLAPVAAAAQRPAEIAFADPQPHFIAAWAPKKAHEAERSAVLARRLSLELADVSLDAALKALTNEAGLNITYSPSVLPSGRRVTIKANDIAVVTALTEILFRSGLDVVVDRDGTLALVPCRHPVARLEVQDSGTIVGTVTDKATGAPIAGATVLVERASLAGTTSVDGRFRIGDVPAGSYTLRVRYIGYAPLQATVVVPEGGEVRSDFALAKSLQRLDELVTVTPGGMQTQLRALPSPVSVITTIEIQSQRPLALLEVIRQAVPGAVAFFSPSRPDATSFSVRGASSLAGLGAMKVFVDGVEASTFGDSPVDPASIDRIEVVRGPQAATLYGSDAAGGVIQIFTKRGEPGLERPELEVQAQLGVVETPYEGRGGVLRQQYHGSVRGGGPSVGYNFGGGFTRLGDWLPTDEQTRQSAPSAYAGVEYARGAVGVDLHGRYLRNQLPAVLNPLIFNTGFVLLSVPLYAEQDLTNETYGARFRVSPRTWWHNQLTLGVDRFLVDNVQYRRRFTTPDDSLFQVFTQNQRKVSLGYNTALTAPVSGELTGSVTAGIDYYRTDANSFFTAQALNTQGTIQTSPPGSASDDRSRITNTGYFTQVEIGWREKLFLTAGLRADDNSTFGQNVSTQVSPRVGITIVQELRTVVVKIRGAYGKAIRAPSPGQAAGSTSAFQINLANPVLAPEAQFGWDAGIDLAFGNRASISISGYDQIAKNLISSQLVASSPLPTFQFQNIGRVANRGIEVEGAFALHPVTLSAQYAYTHSRIEDLGPAVSPSADIRVGDRPLGLPTHTAGAALTVVPRTGTTVTAGLTYVGSFRQVDLLGLFSCVGGTGPCPSTFNLEYPGFAKLNLSASHRFWPHVEGFLSINNLTNEEAYEGPNSAPVMGRTTIVGAHLTY